MTEAATEREDMALTGVAQVFLAASEFQGNWYSSNPWGLSAKAFPNLHWFLVLDSPSFRPLPKKLWGSPPSCITFCKEVWLSPFSLRERRRNGYRSIKSHLSSWTGQQGCSSLSLRGRWGEGRCFPALENPDRPGRPWVRGMCSQAGPGHWESHVKIIELVSLFYAEIFQLAVGTIFFPCTWEYLPQV